MREPSRRLAAATAAAGVICSALVVCPAAFGSSRAPRIVRLTTTPALFPRLAPCSRLRYSLRSCDGGAAHDLGGCRYDDDDRRRADSQRDGTLVPGREVVVTGHAATGTTSYHVRCLPADFPAWSVTGSGTAGESYVATPVTSFAVATADYVAIFDSDGVPIWWWRDAIGPPIDATVPAPARDSRLVAVPRAAAAGAFQVRRLDGTLVRRITSPDGAHRRPRAASARRTATRSSSSTRRGQRVDLTPYGGPARRDGARAAEIEEVTPRPESSSGRGRPTGTSTSYESNALAGRRSSARRYQLAGRRCRRTTSSTRTRSRSTRRHGAALAAPDRRRSTRSTRATGQILWKLGGTPTRAEPHRRRRPGRRRSARRPARRARTAGRDDHACSTTAPSSGGRPAPSTTSIDVANRTRPRSWDRSPTPRCGEARLCCGSARLLADGDWVVSWGGDAVVGEYRPDGTPRVPD